MVNKLNALLLLVTLMIGLAVVTLQHQSRSIYSQLERMEYQANQLNAEYQQLQLEQSTWGAHNLVDSVATTRLGTHVPDSTETLVLDPNRPGYNHEWLCQQTLRV